MDYQLFERINGLAGQTVWLDRSLVLVALYAPLLYGAALVWLWGIRKEGCRERRDRLAVGRALAAAAVALGLGQLIIRVYLRPRPFVGHAVRLLIPPSPDPSFPSDHALAAFAIAAALVSTRRRLGIGLFGLAALLAFARVFVGTHYPLDVVAGAILGTAVGALMHLVDAWLAPFVALGAQWTDAVAARIWRRTALQGSTTAVMPLRVGTPSWEGHRRGRLLAQSGPLFFLPALVWRWIVPDRRTPAVRDRQGGAMRLACGRALLASPRIASVRDRYRRPLAWFLARMTPGQSLGLHLTVGVLATVGGLWLFGGILQDILVQDPLVRADASLAQTLQVWATPMAATVFRGISRLASVGGLTVLTVGVLARYGRRRQWLRIAAWIVAVGGGEGLLYVFRILLARLRPALALRLVAAGGHRFPSGHAMVVLIAYGLAAYFMILDLRSWRLRTGVVCAAIVVVLLAGFSRLYLRVHSFSDVVGGYAAGLAWLSACVTAAESIRRGDLGDWWREHWQGWH